MIMKLTLFKNHFFTINRNNSYSEYQDKFVKTFFLGNYSDFCILMVKLL